MSRRPDKHRGVKRARPCHTAAPEDFPLAKLQLDLLPLVFQYVVDASDGGGVFATLRLSHVSRTWRGIAMKMPSLWTDVRLYDFVSSYQHEVHARALIRHCAQHSRNTITHADLRGYTDVDLFRDCFETLKLSAASLESLEIYDNNLCHCDAWYHWRGPYTRDYAYKRRNTGLHAVARFGQTLLKLLARAPRLDVLILDVCLAGVTSIDEECAARPRTLTLRKPMTCCDWYENPPEADDEDTGTSSLLTIRDFLDRLVSRVEDFVLDDDMGGFTEDLSWASLVMHRQRQTLRSFRMPVWPTITGDTVVPLPITFPVLEDIRLHDFEASPAWTPGLYEHAIDRPVWLRTPALRSIFGPVSLVAKIQCPSVTAAYLEVQREADVDEIAKLLAAWPDLESLTIEITRDPEAPWTTAAIKKILAMLNPVVSEVVHVPKLSELGIVGTPLNPRFGRYVEPRWTSQPWTAVENECWRRERFKNTDRVPKLYVGKELSWVHTVRSHLHGIHETSAEVRQLAQICAELPPRATSSEAAAEDTASLEADAAYMGDSCAPLRIIKLRGVYMESSLWKELRQGSPARVTCRPKARLKWAKAPRFYPAFDAWEAES